jgi:hypothetical protein
MTAQEKKETYINARTWVPLGAMIGVVSAILLGSFWMDNRFDTLENNIYKRTQYRWDSNNEATAWAEFSALNEHTSGVRYILPDIRGILTSAQIARDEQ